MFKYLLNPGFIAKLENFRISMKFTSDNKYVCAYMRGLIGSGYINLSLEKEMATYSSLLAWKIPWTEEPGGLESMGSQELLSYLD